MRVWEEGQGKQVWREEKRKPQYAYPKRTCAGKKISIVKQIYHLNIKKSSYEH